MRRAVVLLSGGLDSATTLALAVREGFEAHALTVRYGQRHALEVDRARSLAAALGAASHEIVDLDLSRFGGSALVDRAIPVPVGRDGSAIGRDIPSTYVPARNTIFLSLALAFAEVLEAGDLFLGANAIDYSGYPDCRPEYLRAFEALANLATRAAVEGRRLRVHAPLLERGKGEIVRLALDLGVDLAQTLSCYDPTPAGAPCGACDACVLRRRGFEEAGVPDPGSLPPDGGRG
jgi:7-cyano-7-deazaguanine synthase